MAIPRLLLVLLLGLATASAQKPEKTIDLGQFPADTIDNVVVPVPSEIFTVLDKLGNPNWRAQLGPEKNYPASPNRAQVALLLGTVIADGFVAVEAEEEAAVGNTGCTGSGANTIVGKVFWPHIPPKIDEPLPTPLPAPATAGAASEAPGGRRWWWTEGKPRLTTMAAAGGGDEISASV